MDWSGRIAVVSTTVLLGAVAVAWAAAGVSAQTFRVPPNLCTLKVASQVAALGVSGKCKPSKTGKIGAMTISGASWGTATKSVGITMYRGLAASRFKAQFGSLGSPVALGSFAREDAGSSGVTLSSWVDGVGLVINLNRSGTTATNNAYRGRVLALGKAVAKQI